MSERPGPVVVAGATGKQGGAVVAHLLQQGWQVRAMTRTKESAAAQRLAQLGAEVVQADFLDRSSLTVALTGAYGAFSLQNTLSVGMAEEVMQGYAFADAALACKVQHLVYASICQADAQTGIEHFESKWHIEQHLRQIGLPNTVCRPVFFIENLVQVGGLTAMVWGALKHALRGGRKLQVVSVDDVGAVVAQIFQAPASFVGQCIELIGDELTFEEMVEVRLRVLGKRPFGLPVPSTLLRLIDPDLAAMFSWLHTTGFSADLAAARAQFPSLRRFEEGYRLALQGAKTE